MVSECLADPIWRSAALLLVPTLGEDQARKLLEAALLDTNTAARWQARTLILARGLFDLAGFYRRTLASATQPAVVRGALLGLGESGKPDDLALVTPFFSAERLSVQCAALRARVDLEPPVFGRVIPRRPEAARAECLQSAAAGARGSLAYVRASILQKLVVDQSLPPPRAETLSHSPKRSPNGSAGRSPSIAVPTLEEMIANMAVLLVDGWCARYNRSFLQPTPDQVAAASMSFAHVSRRLSANARREIGAIVTILSRE